MAQLSKGKACLQFPIKRPDLRFMPKERSVLRPIPARQFYSDAGASSSAVQSEVLGLGSAVQPSVSKPVLSGRVYQRRKRRNQCSSAVWRVKAGQHKLDAGISQVKEKEAASAKFGDQDTSPAFKEVQGDGAGELKIVPDTVQQADQADRQLENSFPGLESEEFRQAGFAGTPVAETTEQGERGMVVGNELSLALSAEGGGLLLTPQVNTSQMGDGLGTSGSDVDLVIQRKGEGMLDTVVFSAIEGNVGIDSAAFFGEPLVVNYSWKGLGDFRGSGSSCVCVTAEECDHIDYPSMLLEHFLEGPMLLDKTSDGEGELECFEPLVIAPLAVEVEDRRRVSPRWVVERIKKFYPIIGLSCGRFEDRLLALFEEIEEARDLSLADSKTKVSPAQGMKGKRELNRLTWSMNYEKKGAQSDRGRLKGRGSARFYDA
jgi:hypothetical protein